MNRNCCQASTRLQQFSRTLPLRLATMIDRNGKFSGGNMLTFSSSCHLTSFLCRTIKKSSIIFHKFIFGIWNQFRRIFAPSDVMTSEFTETQLRIFSEAFCLRLIRLQGSENENRIKIESNEIIFLQALYDGVRLEMMAVVLLAFRSRTRSYFGFTYFCNLLKKFFARLQSTETTLIKRLNHQKAIHQRWRL